MADPIRFYFDQHIPSAVTTGMRQHGVDVLTAQEANRCGATDPEQLAFSTVDGRVLVTFDIDFLVLDAAGVRHAGIAWCPARKYSIGQLIQALLLVHGVLDRDEMSNHAEYL
jgi:predicted nuclease of predicted toxin-antitoxin system